MATPSPESGLYKGLVLSDDLESIYHADLFVINGKNWLIQGYGKSAAGQMASGPAEALAMDHVAIIRGEDGRLYGRLDGGVYNKDGVRSPRYHIDVVAYCLNECETVVAYKPRNGQRSIVDIGAEHYSRICKPGKYAGVAALLMRPDLEGHLANPKRMIDNLVGMVIDVRTTHFLLVPFMSAPECKANLYRSYDFA
ncbi:hypothetical protein I5V52_04275 [Stenotrophomonas maltophilia]|jgi:hypothetical protein|uniref:hypothetical protein n=1 Tax=Stenotrophomonas maltophilia TaxID=40324 RepID=UPI0013D9CD0A|nr:hypothetical protein [Stenotrophomonas maltophilia]MBH1758037.1 hypothetical protein [Stenotrophomonas maltophilia]MBH1762404.1 hypothetical protein [Stenotrophomonas maltophilia]MBH1771140.1 hypothetical protein [Stenotrophomonas maltophilia]HEL3850060.1 hypothetical protein [Stenotrophomonas maltophilia]